QQRHPYDGRVTDRSPQTFDEVVDATDADGYMPYPEPEEPRGSALDRWWCALQPRTRTLARWGSFAGVVAIAAVTRLWNLGSPGQLVFDESFYVKDAWTLWNLGYEAQWPAESDVLFNAGQTDGFLQSASYVVHPPLGKWIIGAG